MVKLSPRLARFAAAFAAATGLPAPAEDNANYAHPRALKKTGDNAGPTPHLNLAHFPTSEEKQTAINIIRWCYAVSDLRADSPRFAYYVSRWDVPAKVASAIAAGTFDELTANCPPIDPAWVRFVPAALEAHRQFIAAHARPKSEQPKSSGKNARAA